MCIRDRHKGKCEVYAAPFAVYLDERSNTYVEPDISEMCIRDRVNTQLRKQTSSHKNAPIHIDLFHFDFEAMTFYVGDSKVELSKTEQKLLRLLVENQMCIRDRQ